MRQRLLSPVDLMHQILLSFDCWLLEQHELVHWSLFMACIYHFGSDHGGNDFRMTTDALHSDCTRGRTS